MSSKRVKEGDLEEVVPVGEGENPVIVNEPKISPLIYLGPNLPGGRLLQSTVFRGGIPEYLKPLLEEQPDVAALIVPVNEITGVQTQIVQTGTPEYGAYQAILKGGTLNGI